MLNLNNRKKFEIQFVLVCKIVLSVQLICSSIFGSRQDKCLVEVTIGRDSRVIMSVLDSRVIEHIGAVGTSACTTLHSLARSLLGHCVQLCLFHTF